MKFSKEEHLLKAAPSGAAATTPDLDVVTEPAAKGPQRRWMLVTAGLCIALLSLVFVCYRNTLGSYFLADDFGEIYYMSRVWNGEWNLYLADWTSNTMNVPGMAVYRPWFITSLVFDFFFFRGNPFGYYLSNITYFAADVLLLFFIVRELTRSWSTPRSLGCSFSAAALFAMSPLHCESVSWVGGRTDSLCAVFFLSGLLCFLLARSRSSALFAIGTVVSFWLGILTKEMAIGLPIIATAIAFIYPLRPMHPETPWVEGLLQRAKDALSETSALWISTVGYFAVRFLTLGTIFGGYTAGLGDAQSAGALRTWLDLDSYRRFIFPFGADIVSPNSSIALLLVAAYIAAGLLIIVRASRGQLPVRMLALLGIWIFAALLPIYRLWGIGPNLEGARYCFFLTIPGSLLLPILLLAPWGQDARPKLTRWFTAAAALAIAGLLFVNGRALSKTNREWVEAGNRVRAIATGAKSLVQNLPAGKDRVLIFSVPKTHLGAHMMYNGPTLMTALKPPFTEKDYEQNIESTDHLFFGLDQYINSARFKQLVASERVDGPYAWDLDGKQFYRMIYYPSAQRDESLVLPLNMTASSVQVYTQGHAVASGDGQALHLSNLQAGDGLRFGNLHINPLDVDFIEIEYKLPAGEHTQVPLRFQARWQGSDKRASISSDLQAAKTIYELPTDSSSRWQTVRIPVSHYWRWYGCGNISALSVMPPAATEIEIRRIALVCDRHLRPTVIVQGAKVDGSGVHYVTNKSSLSIDATGIPGAVSVRVESSKPNFFFDQHTNSKDGLHVSKLVPGSKANVPYTSNLSPVNTFSEIRAQAMDVQGKPIGEPSDAQVIFAQVH